MNATRWALLGRRRIGDVSIATTKRGLGVRVTWPCVLRPQHLFATFGTSLGANQCVFHIASQLVTSAGLQWPSSIAGIEPDEQRDRLRNGRLERALRRRRDARSRHGPRRPGRADACWSSPIPPWRGCRRCRPCSSRSKRRGVEAVLYDRVRVEPTDESFRDAIAFAQRTAVRRASSPSAAARRSTPPRR